MAVEQQSLSERLGERSTATHGRRIAVYMALLLLGVGLTIWLVTDPHDALSGHPAIGVVLAPVSILLFVAGLVREIRTGDSRDWRPFGGGGRN